MIGSRNRPSTVCHQSVSYDASEGIRQLSAGQYHQPSHVDLGLPLTILTAGFASGTNPDPTRQPDAGSPGQYERAAYAAWF